MGFGDNILLKTIAAVIDYSEQKKADEWVRETKQQRSISCRTATQTNLERARGIYGRDAPLGYLYYSRTLYPEYKSYFSKEHWLHQVHSGKKYSLRWKEDMQGWNPLWGSPAEEYQKWCDQHSIPTFQRRLTSYFENPISETLYSVPEQKPQNFSNSSPPYALYLIAVCVLFLICIAGSTA